MLNQNVKFVKKFGERERYEFVNKKGEKITIYLSVTHCNPNDKKCLPNLWKKHGYIKEAYYDYINIETFVETPEGCFHMYNPQHTKEHKINFKWLLPDSLANKHKLLNEVYRLANN